MKSLSTLVCGVIIAVWPFVCLHVAGCSAPAPQDAYLTNDGWTDEGEVRTKVITVRGQDIVLIRCSGGVAAVPLEK